MSISGTDFNGKTANIRFVKTGYKGQTVEVPGRCGDQLVAHHRVSRVQFLSPPWSQVSVSFNHCGNSSGGVCVMNTIIDVAQCAYMYPQIQEICISISKALLTLLKYFHHLDCVSA